jgi:2-hydroxychromene-2-carboxylate isomerase
MTSPSVQFLFDFGSPNAYLCHRVIPAIEERIHVQRNPFFPVNTLKIMRGAVAAQTLGCLAPYVQAMYVAMWEEARNMDDLDQIVDVLKRAGLDAEKILATSQLPEVKAALILNTETAAKKGAFGSPSFLVNDDLYFGKDRLGEVEAALSKI